MAGQRTKRTPAPGVAVIGYVDQNGGRHQVLAEPTKDQAPVGAVHRVGYDPGNPDRGGLIGTDRWLGPIVTGVIAVVGLAGAERLRRVDTS